MGINATLAASTTKTRTRRLANPRGELPPEVREMIRERRRAKKTAMRTRLPEDKRITNQISRRTRAALDEVAQEKWRLHLESLDPQDRSLWKTKRALGIRRRPMPPIQGENGIVYTKEEKAEALADSLELQCRENDNEDEDHTLEVERRIPRMVREPDRDQIRPTAPEEVKDVLKRLLANMILIGYPVAMVKLTKSYLEGRKIRVKVDEALSTYRHIEAGVPQSTVLSPHLFSIYTSDLPRTENTVACLYADDAAILARSTQLRMATTYLQRAMEQLEGWCDRWKVASTRTKALEWFFQEDTLRGRPTTTT